MRDIYITFSNLAYFLCFYFQGRQSNEDVVSSKPCGRSVRIGHVLLRVSRPSSKTDFKMSSLFVDRGTSVDSDNADKHKTISHWEHPTRHARFQELLLKECSVWRLN